MHLRWSLTCVLFIILPSPSAIFFFFYNAIQVQFFWVFRYHVPNLLCLYVPQVTLSMIFFIFPTVISHYLISSRTYMILLPCFLTSVHITWVVFGYYTAFCHFVTFPFHIFSPSFEIPHRDFTLVSPLLRLHVCVSLTFKWRSLWRLFVTSQFSQIEHPIRAISGKSFQAEMA